MFLISNDRFCNKAPIDESLNDLYGILITQTPELTAVSTGEDFNTNHFIYGLVGTLYLSID